MRILIVMALLLVMFNIATVKAEDKRGKSFIGMENTVGYITDNMGNKFIIIETEDGAKLVKVRENPKRLFNGGLGISKEDLKDIKVK